MLPRKSIIGVKIESVYGTDSVPTAALNCIQVRNLKHTPLKVDTEKTETIQGYLGNTDSIPVMEEVVSEFEVLLAGSGTPATAPKWGPILRACAHSETILAADVTGTAQAGSTTTITLAAGASAVDGFYAGMILDATAGAGSGQSSVIVDYNGTTKVATLAGTEAVAYTNTTQYAIRANVQYRPISASMESVSLYVWNDGILYKGIGSRGTVMFDYTAKKIPFMKVRLVCIYAPVTDVTFPTNADFSGFLTPRAAIPLWMPELYVHGYAAKTASVSMDQAGDVQHQVWMNAESVEFVDRKPAGKMTVEAVTVATKDYFGTLRAVTKAPFAMRHGTASGNSIVLMGPKVQLETIEPTEVNGVAGFGLATVWNPNRGNDEYTLTSM
jgi:hypothetical protein